MLKINKEGQNYFFTLISILLPMTLTIAMVISKSVCLAYETVERADRKSSTYLSQCSEVAR